MRLNTASIKTTVVDRSAKFMYIQPDTTVQSPDRNTSDMIRSLKMHKTWNDIVL